MTEPDVIATGLLPKNKTRNRRGEPNWIYDGYSVRFGAKDGLLCDVGFSKQCRVLLRGIDVFADSDALGRILAQAPNVFDFYGFLVFPDLGITLTTVGVGMGNYNDALLEQLANNGDGNYMYIDDENEARSQFVNDVTSNLQVIARDAKIQVDFNADTVVAYRQLGYENRAVADSDFRNDTVDACGNLALEQTRKGGFVHVSVTKWCDQGGDHALEQGGVHRKTLRSGRWAVGARDRP